jgi:hypothetical protein
MFILSACFFLFLLLVYVSIKYRVVLHAQNFMQGSLHSAIMGDMDPG